MELEIRVQTLDKAVYISLHANESLLPPDTGK